MRPAARPVGMTAKLYREVTLTLTYRVDAVDCPVPTEREAERLVLELVEPPRAECVVRAPEPYDWTMKVSPTVRQVAVSTVQVELKDPAEALAEYMRRTLGTGAD